MSNLALHKLHRSEQAEISCKWAKMAKIYKKELDTRKTVKEHSEHRPPPPLLFPTCPTAFYSNPNSPFSPPPPPPSAPQPSSPPKPLPTPPLPLYLLPLFSSSSFQPLQTGSSLTIESSSLSDELDFDEEMQIRELLALQEGVVTAEAALALTAEEENEDLKNRHSLNIYDAWGRCLSCFKKAH